MNSDSLNNKLKRDFYTRDVVTVARELLGKVLVKIEPGIIYAGVIAEVEAYDGAVDQAAHTFGGKTKRNAIMFGEGGFFYVYFTYGSHYCCNIVTGKEGSGTAVLIRGVEPLIGTESMILNRFGRELKNEKEIINLTNGPGKVCKAFAIDKTHYGTDLTGDRIFIVKKRKLPDNKITVTKRIGIKKSVDLPWRFYITDNLYVSRK